MKKVLVRLLALAFALSLTACGKDADLEEDRVPAPKHADCHVAMITDCYDVMDQSFNQTTYEACKAFCETENLPFQYYKPVSNDTSDRIAMVERAVEDGCNVIVTAGYNFAQMLVAVQDRYPEVDFVALDVAEFDIEESFYHHDADGTRTSLIHADAKPHLGQNVYCAVYQEELCGYMAGYAAVKLGYRHLGFLGGESYPSVERYGYGFIQGIDAAASELDVDATVEYIYGNQFYGDGRITACMDDWYQNRGVEVVFACGGGIYTSAAAAAAKVEGGRVIGVDVDQAGIIDSGYGRGMTVTSAMKGLAATVDHILSEIIAGNFDDYGGRVETLGLVSGEDPTLNFAQLPLETTQWSSSFTQEDYRALVKAIFDGEIQVSADTSMLPAHRITVHMLGVVE